MKIDYDHPGHVNDVIITSCITIHGVKQKKNPRYTSKFSNHIFQSYSTHTKSGRLYAYIVYSKQKLMNVCIFDINFFPLQIHNNTLKDIKRWLWMGDMF
jgi:hypothetical protein